MVNREPGGTAELEKKRASSVNAKEWASIGGALNPARCSKKRIKDWVLSERGDAF